MIPVITRSVSAVAEWCESGSCALCQARSRYLISKIHDREGFGTARGTKSFAIMGKLPPGAVTMGKLR